MTTKIAPRLEPSNASIRTTRDPFNSLREEMNDLISRMWSGYEGTSGVRQLSPALDVSETESAYEVQMDSPGMDSKDFDVQVHGNVVTLSGHRHEVHEDKSKTFHRVERRSGSFSRTLTLPCDVNAEDVEAKYSNGVLSVTLPKSEKSKPKKISVNG